MKLRVKIDDQAFEVEVGDLSARPILAVLDGETYEIWPEDTAPTEAPAAPPVRTVTAPSVPAAAKAPPASAPVEPGKVVTAPIPGTIVSIAVKVGEQVKAGQEICSLEAMKMKNAIRANHPGTIARVLVQPGDRVSQGQPLVEYAD